MATTRFISPPCRLGLRWVSLLALFALLWSTRAGADPGVWMGQLFTLNPAPDKAHGPLLWLDLHQRQTGGTFNAIVRPGVGFQVAPGLTLWGGYAWIPTVTDEVRHEHRSWQQAIGTASAGSAQLMGRVRFEQRWLPDAGNVGLRVRGFARVGVPITGPVGLSVWDEAFLRINDNGGNSELFDQNRVFVGGYYTMEGGRVEMGYLNLKAGTDGVMHHLAAANLVLSPKLKR